MTGATGFIGRHLVEQCCATATATCTCSSARTRARSSTHCSRAGRSADRVKPVVGDLQQPNLGHDDAWVEEHRGRDRARLPPRRDLRHDRREDINERLNVGGTRHAVELANALGAGHLHHVSSVAVDGRRSGHVPRGHVRRGPGLPSPYHRTKYESERIVRERPTVPWRVYRPSIVIGDSQTGEMDKIDGPYYFFKLIQKAATCCRSGSRSSAPSWAGRTSSRSTTSPARWTTSPTSPASTARRSTSRRRSRSARARCSTRSPGPRTRRTSRCASTSASPTRCPRASCR